MEEYICRDGRMSVNGVCAIDQQDSSEAYDTTRTIIDVSDRLKRKKSKDVDDKTLDILPQDYFPELGTVKKKKKFSWDMDKPSTISNFNTTISENISAYDKYVEDKFGIPTNVQNIARFGSAAYSISQGAGLAAVLGPFALPIIFGGGIKQKEKKRIERLTDLDRQGDNKAPIDMMTYDIPTYGQEGFNIHSDQYDKNKADGSGGYTGGFDSSTGNYSDPYSDDTE